MKEDEETKAKAALEAKRRERQRMDDLMRNPAQQPPEPSKPILKKGARMPSSKARTPPDPSSEARRTEMERQRREWRQGLKDHIQQQRVHTPPPQVCCPPPRPSLPPAMEGRRGTPWRSNTPHLDLTLFRGLLSAAHGLPFTFFLAVHRLCCSSCRSLPLPVVLGRPPLLPLPSRCRTSITTARTRPAAAAEEGRC